MTILIFPLPNGITRIPFSFNFSTKLALLYFANKLTITILVSTGTTESIQEQFAKAAAIDLAGRNIVDAVQTSVNPKVIDCPDPNKTSGGMLDLSLIHI